MTAEDVERMMLGLIALRDRGATICPSEVARAVAAAARGSMPSQADWRAVMPMVHAATDRLLADRHIRLSWRGRPLATREGPYRIGRGERG